MGTRDQLVYRLATVGLAAVLVFLAGFSIFSSLSTREAADVLQRSEQISGAYEAVAKGVAVEQAQSRAALAVEPGTGLAAVRRERESSRVTTEVGLQELSVFGESDDRRLGRALTRRAAAVSAAVDDEIAALERGDQAGARGIQRARVEPAVLRVERRLDPAAEMQRGDAASQVSALAADNDTAFVRTIIAFSVGFILLGLFGGVIRAFHLRRRAAERARLEAERGRLEAERQGLEAEERRQDAERRSLDSDRRSSEAFDRAPIGMAMVGLTGMWLRVNDALCAMLGRPAGELIGSELAEVTHPEDSDDDLSAISAAVDGTVPRIEREKRYLRPDGSIVWAQVSGYVQRDDADRSLYTVFQIEDVTERKRAERDRRTQHAVTSVLAEADGWEDAIPDLLRAVGVECEWDLGLMWEVAASTTELQMTGSWHAAGVDPAPFEAASRANTYNRDAGLPGRVWTAAAPVWVEDVTVDEHFLRVPAALEVGLSGAVALPLLAAGEVIGVLEFFARRTLAADPALEATLGFVSSEIGQFLRRSREARETARTIAAVGTARAELVRGADRAAIGDVICAAAREVANAGTVMLFEPDARGVGLATSALDTALALPEDFGSSVIPLDGGDQSAAVRAFLGRRPIFVPELAGDPTASQRLVEATGARSALLQPLMDEGQPIGVLVVVWDRLVPVLDPRVAAAVGLLAADAAAALERADLIARLRSGNRFDEGTGLRNRTALDDELPRELARARREDRPLSLVVLEVGDPSAPAEAGADAMRETAAAVGAQLRPTDVLARLDGSRLAVALPSCPAHDSDTVAGRLVAAGGTRVRAGAATWDGLESAEGLVDRATAAVADQPGRGGPLRPDPSQDPAPVPLVRA